MLAPFLASGDTARGNKAKPLPPNIYILVVMTIRKEISKCQKLINAVEKNSELRDVHILLLSLYIFKSSFENYCSCREEKLPGKYLSFTWCLYLVIPY